MPLFTTMTTNEAVRRRLRLGEDDDDDGLTRGPVLPELTVHEPKPGEPEWTGLYDKGGHKLYRPPEPRRPVGFLHRY